MNKYLIPLNIFATLFLVACSLSETVDQIELKQDQDNSILETEEEPEPEIMLQTSILDSFRYDQNKADYTGTILLTGYAEIAEREEFFCTTNCSKHQYVFFRLLEIDDNNFQTFLSQNLGNSFTLEDGVGLGCLEDRTIISQSEEISEDVTTAILDATKENPITIKLEKLEATKMGATTECYSHFILQ